MLLRVFFSIFVLLISVHAKCNFTYFNDAEKELGIRICLLEAEMTAVQNTLQDVMQKADTVFPDQVTPVMNKRKNEFIRFGKRANEIEKRKNEFIRFGKRKNEFIRFGRSDPELQNDDLNMEKRKNEFIRFG